MIDREKVIKGLQESAAYFRSSFDAMYGTVACEKFRSWTDAIEQAIALLKAQEPITGETSDGYHTFNELYHHRAVLFSVIVANYPDRAWKSKKHHDGTMYDNMFIVGIDTPDGQATYHYDVDPYWDMFKCRVLDNAPEWDGHTPAQAIERIGKLKAQESRVMKVGDVRKWVNSDRVMREPIVIEIRGGVCAWIIDDEVRELPGEANLSSDLYGKTWHCWTSRPTEEQREAMAWE